MKSCRFTRTSKFLRWCAVFYFPIIAALLFVRVHYLPYTSIQARTCASAIYGIYVLCRYSGSMVLTAPWLG